MTSLLVAFMEERTKRVRGCSFRWITDQRNFLQPAVTRHEHQGAQEHHTYTRQGQQGFIFVVFLHSDET